MAGEIATTTLTLQRHARELRRIAFAGTTAPLNEHVPGAIPGIEPIHIDLSRAKAPTQLDALRSCEAEAIVLLDPAALSMETLKGLPSLPSLTLGVLRGYPADDAMAQAIGALNRVVSFDPRLTGSPLGQGAIWRAVPPPISDRLFGEVRRVSHLPRTMSIGRSTDHREAMLTPSKHHHDLLHVIHGVTGPELARLLGEYDIGVYVAPHPGGGFGPQVGIHLAAGQLLLAERLVPAHGLERDIDYLEINSPGNLEWTLQRLRRFPEMHHRLKVRGRMKAEQFRASRVFGRLLHDLFADVAAFGRTPPRVQSAAELSGR